MERLEENIPPSTLVQELRVGQQQVVEIARALAADARILIMDEPTSALSATEVEVLFKVIRELTAHGVAIVYISHHLEEAIEIADYAVVFRDGELVATEEAANIDLSWVVRQMVGREADYDFRDEPRDFGDVALSIQGVTVAEPDTGRVVVNDVSLDVRQGEIVCLYGLMGAGRTELMEALAGRDPISGGRVLLGDQDIADLTIGDRIANGMGLVPEDRQRDGLVQMMSVGKNMSLASLLQTVKNLLHRSQDRTRERGPPDQGCEGQDGRAGRVDHLALGRQPAEGRHREDLADQSEGHSARRANPRNRCRSQGRDLRPALPRG